MITLVDGTIPVAADFNTNYTRLNQAIGTATNISTWAVGEIPYASAINTLSRLAPGSIGQILTMGLTTPAWTNGAITAELTGLTLSNNVSDATNDIDIAVGAAASNDTVVANRILMSLTTAITKRLDATWVVGTNQGGLASGGAIANTTYHVFLIMRPDTGVVDVAFDSSATGANLSANTNAAYTKIRRIGSILREGGAIVAFTQDGDFFQRTTPLLSVDTTNPGTSAITATLFTPVGINVVAYLNVGVTCTTAATQAHMYVSDLASSDQAASDSFTTAWAAAATSTGTGGAQAMVRTNTSAQVRYRMSFSDGNVIARIRPVGWFDRRGRG